MFSCGSGSNTGPDKEAATQHTTTSKPVATKETPPTASPAVKSENEETNPEPEPIPEIEPSSGELESVDKVKNRPHSTEGDCIYIDFKGIATITNISAAPNEGDNCPDAMLVEFNFAPYIKTDVRKYKYTLFQDEGQYLTINGGLNPSKAWLDRMGVNDELVLHALRRELFQGKCSHVIFEFPELEMNPKERCK